MMQRIALSTIALIVMMPAILQANEREFRQQLLQQLPTLWQLYRPVCLMALPADIQLRTDNRMRWLDERMQGQGLARAFERSSAPTMTLVWRQAAWKRMQLLEQQALEAHSENSWCSPWRKRFNI